MRKEADTEVFRPLDKTVVAAKLITGVTIDEIDAAVGLWSPYLKDKIESGVARPQHAHWAWEKKARKFEGLPYYVFCGISVEEELQALMLREDTFARAKHPDQKDTSIVYVEFLSTAPWNDRDIVPTPAYTGCGTILVQEAIVHSLSRGYRGRVGLHALPQAEEFYRNRCEMIDLGPDPSSDHFGLRYFEHTKETGQAFLQKTKRRKRK